MNYIENESEKKKQKKMFVIVPLLMVFVITGVIFCAYFVTQKVEDMNIILPNNLAVTRFTDNDWSSSRSAVVVKESTKKKIVRCIKRLDLEKVYEAPGNLGEGTNYYIRLEFENEEDGSMRIETYYITGNYIMMNESEWNTISKKEAENLKDILDDALRGSSRYGNDMQIYG